MAIALAAAYALPLFAPPGPAAPALPAAEWSLLERIFPGVPPAWVVPRLLALAAAAAWIAAATPKAVLRLARETGSEPIVGRGFLLGALAFASLHALATLLGPEPRRTAQELHVLAVFVPAALVSLGTRVRADGQARGSGRDRAGVVEARAMVAGVLSIVALWIAITALASQHSPRAADAVDTWSGLETLLAAADSSRNLLRESDLPGVPGTYLFLQGVGAVGSDAPGSAFAFVKALHLAWLSLSALGVAWLAACLVSPASAAVAAAAFLASPFVSMIPFQTAPYFLGAIVTTGLLLALLAFEARRAPAALVALGGLIGIATAMPPVWPAAALVGSALLVRLALGPRPPATVLAIGLLAFFCAAWPGLPGPDDLAAMTAAYTEARGSWLGLELMVMGQLSPFTPTLWEMGAPGPLDVPIGSLLAPFAIPRTPLRLWGDALFDPIGAALAALGIAIALRFAVRSPASTFLLLLLGASLASGMVSSFDRPSHTRLFALPVPLALASAVGFEALRRKIAPNRGAIAGLSVALVIALGGAWYFHRVTPPLLAQSSVGIALRALGEPPRDAVFLTHSPPAELDWLHVDLMAAAVPAAPIEARPYQDGAALVGPEGQLRAELFFYSPGLEQDERVTAGICARFAGAALYVLRDPAGISASHAARPAGGAWVPALPASQWEVSGCSPR